MRSALTVSVPGSTSNLGSGFDCVGIAIGRRLRVRVRIDPAVEEAVRLERCGMLEGVAVPQRDDRLYAGFVAACRAASREPPTGVVMTADSDIPVGRGLGSSGAATVAGAVAADRLLGLELGDDDLMEVCARVEGHPDNVAPALFGGATLAVAASERWVTDRLDLAPDLTLAFAIPDFTLDTEEARAALPETVPHAVATAAAARAAALVRGLTSGDPTLLAVGLDDLLHVPHRRPRVPGYDEVVAAARREGAYGATLSGAGPSIVAVAPAGRVGAIAEAMVSAWSRLDVEAEPFTARGREQGYSVDPGDHVPV